MAIERIKCPVCGNSDMLHKIGGADSEYWSCECCDSKFAERLAKREYEKLEATIRAELESVGAAITAAVLMEKTVAFNGLRSHLIKRVRANYIDSKEIVKTCRKILELKPGDFLAEFFEVANSGTRKDIAEYINGIDEEENAIYMDLVLDFITRSLKEEYITPTAALLERCSKIFTPEKKQEFYTRFETEAALVKAGNYEVGVQRDVFLAYSSKDLKEVRKLLDYIESDEIGLTCFAAFRNLQHGRDAVANYEKALKEAMDNCSIFLFVSSVNSRSFSCDAFKVEMAYIRNSEMNKHPECRNYAQLPEKFRKLRIEYRLDNKNTPLVDRNMKDFFAGLTYAEDYDQLVERLGYCMGKLTDGYEETDSAEVEANLKAELEAKIKADYEAKLREKEDARYKADLEAKIKADYEAKLKAENEAKRKIEEEAKLKAELEAKIKADYEAKLKAEADARRRAEEDAKRKAAELEAKLKAESEAKLRAEAEAKRKAEDEAKLKNEFDNLYAAHSVKKSNLSTHLNQISAKLVTKRDTYKADKRRYESANTKYQRKDYGNGYYVGEYANGLRNGYGIFYWNGGDRYEGSWTNDKKTGYAIVYHKSGNRYEGDLVDGQRTGYGSYYWNNGDRYEGQFLNNARTGYGTYSYSNGDRYEGEFENGERNGYGTLYKRNGDVYSGTWIDSENANDVLKIASNGQKSHGKFKNDRFVTR